MKNCRWLFFAFLGLYSIQTHAGHILGTDINYVYVGPNQYLISVRWYRDCLGLPASTQVSICYSSVSLGVSNTLPLPQSVSGGYVLPNFPYIPPYTNSCNGGSGLGIELSVYQGLLNLPGPAPDWIISYSTYPQNIGIGQNFMYVSTKIDNSNNAINTSSFFITDPTFIYCINQPAWDNFSCMDPDGDSLVYTQIPILDNTTVCPTAPFLNPLPPFPPLQSSIPVTMNPTNGSLTFFPTTVGQAMVAAQVDEYRGGVLINSTTRQHVMYLITNCTVTGIKDPESFHVDISPNPVNDVLKLQWDNSFVPQKIEAIDQSGKIIAMEFDYGNKNELAIPVTCLASGIYTLRVISQQGSAMSRFLKL